MTKSRFARGWIEELVLEYVAALIHNEDLLDFIAENTYQYYLAQNTETSYTDSLWRALEETEKSIANLVRALEAGIFNETTKQRMDRQKEELQGALAASKPREDLGLKKEHILYFLHQFANMDCTDLECQKQLIKTFVNSVFVYDNKVVCTFNYSGDNRMITFHELTPDYSRAFVYPVPWRTIYKSSLSMPQAERLRHQVFRDFCPP